LTAALEILAARTIADQLDALSDDTLLGLRNKASALLRSHLKSIHDEAERRLFKNGDGTACAMFLSEAEDQIIRALFARAATATKANVDNISIVAVGGYGRGTLAPGSDIDLLFLVPDAQSTAINKLVEFILYALWDARQKVGHATRTIEDCIKMARSDNTINTSMLEARFVAGDATLFTTMVQRYRQSVVQKNAKSFVADKLSERDLRHAKYGESRYAVEPDIKDGKGGLRDLHTLFWIAKFLFNANSTEELAQNGVFTKNELHRFQKCENFLWVVRCHLHFLTKRGEDKLTFDHQSELAERLNYKSHSGLRHVERFMKHYFLMAKEVGSLTRIFCASLEARHLKDAPSLARMFGKFLPKSAGQKLPHGFRMEAGRIDIITEDVFEKDPIGLIGIFNLAAEHGVEIHPDALKAIRLSLRLIDDKLRNNAVAQTMFLECLTGGGDPESILRSMNEAGVLGRFIPEFGHVVAMMQFNMYHHYTVDEHLIRTVGVLRAIETGLLKDDHPLSAVLFPTLTSRRSLYVAGLLHDVAKGRPEDHSIAGERMAKDICPRLGLTPAETETVAWLIRWHLLMSETAQMRDLNDFKTILDFTKIVQSPERLKLLLILTVADIRAVGPGVWNGWKGQLLRTLYAEAEPVLTGGHSAVTRNERLMEAQHILRLKLPETTDDQFKSITQRHYDAYWLTVPVDQQLRHLALMERAAPRDVTTDVRSDAFAAVTEITVYAPDHPRLLATITGACAAANANIIGAQIFTTAEGMALDTILLQREFSGEQDEQRRATRVAETIAKALRGQVRLKDAIAQAKRPEYRVGAFHVEPRVIIDNTSSNRQTVVEINGLDRVGLLHQLTDALFQLNLNIASAHITTFGEKAVDVFYVTDLTGAKIEADTRIKRIEQSLLAVLAPKVEKVA
jgi:[protein-PII] uridylyltransferase